MEYNTVIVGHHQVGKKSLLFLLVRPGVFTSGEIDDFPLPGEYYRKQLVIDDETCMLNVTFEAAQEVYYVAKEVQSITFGSSFVLLYSIASRTSFEKIDAQYHDQIMRSKEQRNYPMILVGNKSDLGDQRREVSREEGEQLAAKYGIPFLEISVRERINVDESLKALVQEIKKFQKDNENQNVKEKKRCMIM